MSVDEANLAYRALTPAEILDCVEAAGYRPDGRLLALNSYENRVYQVGIEDAAPLVAKFYRPGRWSDPAIREEHAFATALTAADVPVVAPLACGGDTLLKSGNFRFALYPRRGGRWPELDDADLLAQIGRFVARLHLVGAAEPFRHRPALDVASFGHDSVETVLAADTLPPELVDAYESLAHDLLARIETIVERTDAAPLRLHGDLHPSNLLERDGVVHIVDLDDARSGPAVQDLWMFLSGPDPERERQLDHLLSGYHEFRDLDLTELGLIEALRTLRLLHYAAWLTRRYDDPAFQTAFPWFAEPRYWETHILSLREQLALLDEAPLRWIPA